MIDHSDSLNSSEEPLVSAQATVDKTYNVKNYGATGNNPCNDTPAFLAAIYDAKQANTFAYVPSGNYQVYWNAPKLIPKMNTALLENCRGEGTVEIKYFPEPYLAPETGCEIRGNTSLLNPAYSGKFGKFTADKMADKLFCSMNIEHEARPNIKRMHHQQYSGTKSRHNPNDAHGQWNCWGQLYLREDCLNKIPTGNVTLCIGRIGLLVYRNSTKSWKPLLTNNFCDGGSLYLKDYGADPAYNGWPFTKSFISRKSFSDHVEMTVNILDLKHYCMHFWSDIVQLKTGNTDIKYVIGFADAWIKNFQNSQNYFVLNLGADMKVIGNPSNTNELVAGRYYKMYNNTSRRVYMHTVIPELYNSLIPSQAYIDNLINQANFKVGW